MREVMAVRAAITGMTSATTMTPSSPRMKVPKRKPIWVVASAGRIEPAAVPMRKKKRVHQRKYMTLIFELK